MEASALHAPARFARLTASPALLRLRSDEQLVSMLRAGSQEAFNTIHERYRQRLFAYVRQMLGPRPRQDAEDVLQDVFARAYTALLGDNREVNLRPWLYRVAHNRCIDHLRRPGPVIAELTETETATKPLHDPFEDVQRREDLKRLVADIGRLPTQQKSALLLREINGLSYNELAEALDVTVPAIKSLLVRARVELVETAEARDVACASIREELLITCDTGGRTAPRTRRHLRDCAGCREYQNSIRGMRRSFAALSPVAVFGPLALLGKLGGLGGTGSGAGAGTGGAAGAGGAGAAGAGAGVAGAGSVGAAGAATLGGAAGVGLGAVTAGKIAAVVATAAITAGGAVALERRVSERPTTTPVAAATATPTAGAAQTTAPGAGATTPGAGSTPAAGAATDPAALAPGGANLSPLTPAGDRNERVTNVGTGSRDLLPGSNPALPVGAAPGGPAGPSIGTPLAPVNGTTPERRTSPSGPGDGRVALPVPPRTDPRPSPGTGSVPDSVRAPETPAKPPRGGPVAGTPVVRPEKPQVKPDLPVAKPDLPVAKPDVRPEAKVPKPDKRPPVAVNPPTLPQVQAPPVKPAKPVKPVKEKVDGLAETPKADKIPPGQVDKVKPDNGQGLGGTLKPDKAPEAPLPPIGF